MKLSEQGEKQKVDDETNKLINSLKQVDKEENKFNDY